MFGGHRPTAGGVIDNSVTIRWVAMVASCLTFCHSFEKSWDFLDEVSRSVCR
jgi:hypothetical protein